MAPPGDPNFDFENGPDEYVDDDISSLKGSLRRQLFRGRRTPTAGSYTSKQSRRSITATPLRVIRRLTNGTISGAPEDEPKRPSDGREIIKFLSRGQLRTDSFLDACDFYVQFIDTKYKAHWRAIQAVVAGVKETALLPDAQPDDADTAKVDEVLVFIAKDLSEKRDFALVDLVNDLINEELIIDNGTDDERAALHQLMFTFLGWLTMLYDPRPGFKPKKLQVAKFTLNTAGNKINLQSRAFDTHGQDIEYVDHPLHLLLGRFGKLIPDLPLQRHSEVAPPSEWIVVPFVCYQTLRAVCRVEIEWVDALAMHLEFDSNRKMLKIFRFPSFCRLMYNYKQRGLLSQLFDDKERDLRGEPSTNYLTSEFFHEMLLTYRLIFGQDPKSSRLFARELATLTASSASKTPSSPSRSKSHLSGLTATKTKPPPPQRQPHVFALPDTDPLLARLCSLRADAPAAHDLYAAINAPSVQSYYTPTSYPFFAERLLALQAYVKEQHPHDWKTLWHDHRNKSNWWQFWAVLFIGGGTLILGTLSLGFQVWQAVLTQQQLVQGAGGVQPLGRPGGDI